MEKAKRAYRHYFRDYRFLWSLIIGLVVLLIALTVNFYAVTYTAEKASNPVTDLVLDNIRVYDVDGLFVFGPIVMWLFAIGLFLAKPQRLPFALKTIGLFVLIRALFISLTHIGPSPLHTIIDPGEWARNFNYLTAGSDLFFSGHTGLPFLLGLMFWDNRLWRYLFIALSLMFGVVVLLGHLHYSIDVLSAFFITYTIYHLASRFFARDRRWFQENI